MKKKVTIIGILISIVISVSITIYAITGLFFTKSETSNLTKKTIFQFDLTTGMQTAELGPGESFAVSPTVFNDATENMYVFIVVDQPTCNDESLYTYTVEEGWKLVSSTAARQVYAYAGDEMTVLMPGEKTEPLTYQFTMSSISNAEYSLIDGINISVTAYAIGTEDASTNPEEAWAVCKSAGNIE